MTEDDPRPLKSSGETPAELASALRAMGRDRDAARLARVAERLAASIAATPAQSWVTRLSRTQIGLAGVALAALVAFVLGYALVAERGTPTGGKPAAPSVASPAQPQEPAPAPLIEPIETSPPTAATPKRQPARASRPAPRSHAQAPAAAPSAEASAAEASGSATAVEPAPATDHAAPAQPEAEPRPKREPAAVAAVAQPSEVTLLQQARSAASQQPTAALRLLEQHAERFPDGLLTPEREVLAIEVLRALGRTEEAAQRLQRFEVRYPKSIHLRRLQRGAAKD
jgi:hypothetical protein